MQEPDQRRSGTILGCVGGKLGTDLRDGLSLGIPPRWSFTTALGMHLQSLFYFVTVPILSVLAASAPQASDAQTYPPTGSSFGVPGVNASFDYVIVGGGTAGLTVATRLAEASSSVAVIEAGGFYEIDNGNLSVVPGYCTFYTGTDISNTQPLVDWSFVTTPQTVRCCTMSPQITRSPNNVAGREQSPHALCSWQDSGRLIRPKFHAVP